jgi:DNA polymerase-3 subunit gamma/tau
LLYGKWRPRSFDEVVGQDHVVQTLRNALATGQVAHAYLFAGPRGTGKTTTARILARALNCEELKAGDPCNRCPSCRAILEGRALDLIEMDAASNRGIDDIRELRDKIAYSPSDLRCKVYLLDEVHMLTQGAFNALLKTLEEPPPHAFFILATTELHQVPATIVSRCQRFDFHRVPNEAIVARLRYIADQEGFALSDQGLLAIAIQSRGGLRDAITLLEQVTARFGPTPSTDEVLEALGMVYDPRAEELACAVLDRDLAKALTLSRDAAASGIDLAAFTREVIDLLRDGLWRAAGGGEGEPRSMAVADRARSAEGGLPFLAHAVAELARADFRLDPASPVPLEVAVASAILGPAAAAVAPAAAAAPTPARQSAPPSRAPRAGGTGQAETSREERFLRELRQRCSMVNVKLGALLNGSCEVLAMDGDELELGFYHSFHMENVERDGRAIVEEQASNILGRPVRLKVRQIPRQNAPDRRPRGGHLIDAALRHGATPVRKEGS